MLLMLFRMPPRRRRMLRQPDPTSTAEECERACDTADDCDHKQMGDDGDTSVQRPSGSTRIAGAVQSLGEVAVEKAELKLVPQKVYANLCCVY